MIQGKTQSGFEYEIQDETLDNMELIELIAQVDSDPIKLPKFLSLFLGEEQKQKLYDHLRTDKGNVPIESVEKEVMEILTEGSKKTKNS